jgi:hypothetical protein
MVGMFERPTIEMPAITRHLASVSRAPEADVSRCADDLDCFVRATVRGMAAVTPPPPPPSDAEEVSIDWLFED